MNEPLITQINYNGGTIPSVTTPFETTSLDASWTVVKFQGQWHAYYIGPTQDTSKVETLLKKMVELAEATDAGKD